MSMRELKNESSQIRRDIVKSINLFKKLKKERAGINKVVKDYKLKRKEAVFRIKNIISKLKKLNNIKNDIEIKDVKKLKSIIEKKEWFFQVNVLSIKKEEEIISEIKLLRKKLKTAKKEKNVLKKIKKLMKDLEKTRAEHNKLHTQVIMNAKKSNEKTKEMRKAQKKIKQLKKKGKSVYAKIKKAKNEKKKLERIAKRKVSRLKNKKKRLIKEKQKKVLSKLKNKKKLTTDDLIVFQK